MTKAIAVIGGGPAGLAAAKALALEPYDFVIDLYEKSDSFGGLWNYDGSSKDAAPPVPSVTQRSFTELPAVSPMYEYLETNIFGRIMEYADVKFPVSKDTFRTRHEVLEYVQAYGDTLPDSVNKHLSHKVVSVDKIGDVWHLDAERQTAAGRETVSRQYYAVVVANGHFDVPFIPDVPGLAHWSQNDPKSVIHSKYFVEGEAYRDKTVLVIGNYSSGLDISIQLAVSAAQVYVSSYTPEDGKVVDGLTNIGAVKSYDYDSRSFTTELGETYTGIDHIIYATGFLYHLPFLKAYPDLLDDTGDRIKDLYLHLFYIPDPTLTFLALPREVIPMPFAESQGAVLARVYSGRLPLPSHEDMVALYEQELEERGAGKGFHTLRFPKDIEYLHKVQKILDDHGLQHDGLKPPVWDADRVADREAIKGRKSQQVEKTILQVNKWRVSGEPYRLVTD